MEVTIGVVITLLVLVVIILGVPMIFLNEKTSSEIEMLEIRIKSLDSFDNKLLNRINALYDANGYTYKEGGRAIKKWSNASDE